ncbi:MAG TPA: DUF805 domain-containing protein [Gemmataceae bacterium]|jgi:uncharacterized membrane protein YhaH (DUF805 family)|nr:DUF805 domain-containing protein [Gemmataceae bacterium]
MQWYLKVLQNYVGFDGRARRTEYWMFTLITIIISIALAVLDVMTGIGVLGLIYGLATFLPGLAVSVRRLHDTNKSGFWILIAFIPLVGAIILLVFMATEGDRGSNNFGADPKGRSSRKSRDDDDRW